MKTAEIINLEERRTKKKADEYLRLYFNVSQAEATAYSLRCMTSKEKKDVIPLIKEKIKKDREVTI